MIDNPQRPEDMEFIWRCKRCHVENHLDGRGGILNCSCDRAHGDWEVMIVSEGGTLPTNTWFDANTAFSGSMPT
jgi:hypothetical protein